MKIENANNTQEFLAEVMAFFKSVDESIFEKNKQLIIKEGEQEDLLHELELGKLNAVEINRVARKLIRTRIERRNIKNNLELLKTIKPLTDIYYKKGINAEINQTMSNIEHLIQTWNDRKYHARVLKDLKCTEGKEV